MSTIVQAVGIALIVAAMFLWFGIPAALTVAGGTLVLYGWELDRP